MRPGNVASAQGLEFAVDATPSVLYDALAIPGGKDAAQEISQWRPGLEFIRERYRHCKPVLAFGAAREILDAAGVRPMLLAGEPDPGLIVCADDEIATAIDEFVKAIAAHRHFAR